MKIEKKLTNSMVLLTVTLLAVNAMAGSLFFEGVKVPVTDDEKRSVLASETAVINGVAYPIGFNTIIRSGEALGGVYGQLLDQGGNPIVHEDGSQDISSSNDFASLIQAGNKLYSVSHFESRPGAMYLTELNQDESGYLTPVGTRNIDFSAWGGLWVPCAGSVTPWGTHLGSEEYPPDAREYAEAMTWDDAIDPDDYDKPMGRYFGVTNPLDPDCMTLDQFKAVFNPYKYGYPVEVAVDGAGNTTVTKHYAMGRCALELCYVMPDQKTAYLSDDGTNCGLYMFVADTAGDLSAGNLYAMRWFQTSASNGGTADLGWIPLGHATFDEVKTAIDSGITFSDMFEVADNPDDLRGDFTSINTEPGHEVLKVKPGMEKIASRLETRRYAALMGATTEFRKEEGITYDPDHNRLYIAISEAGRGMEDFKKGGKDNDAYDRGGWNDIRIDEYIAGGVVYALDIATDDAIGSDYVAQNMYGIVRAFRGNYDSDHVYAPNKDSVASISMPDNLTYLPGYNILIIGEDTGSGHQNDMIWAFNVETEQLTRIQTTPYGSETTSPYWYPNINGFGYLMSVIQHPYGESDQDKLADPADAMGYTGYIGPFPALE